VRGYPIEQLVRERSFGDTIFLLMVGELPKRGEGKLIDAILVSCCEHSLASPSVDAVRFVASTGVPLQTAVAAGVSAIGDVHGGAIEPCARILQDAVKNGISAERILAKLKAEGRRLPGFGHPVHTRDPRKTILLSLAADMKLSGAHTQLACALEKQSVKSLGRSLPMNVDGAIAAILCDLRMDPALGKAFFIIGRCAGYVAHAHEQMTVEKPFKAAGYSEITYTGPARREVPKS
jgi:citrate synthase